MHERCMQCAHLALCFTQTWLPGPAGKLQALKAGVARAASNGASQGAGPGVAGGASPSASQSGHDADLLLPTWRLALLACSGSSDYNGEASWRQVPPDPPLKLFAPSHMVSIIPDAASTHPHVLQH